MLEDEPGPGATETAVIIAVPEADPLVGERRRTLDPAASWGVPAHVTVLYPFLPPDRVDDDVLDRLAGAVRTVTAFGCTFARTAWFDQDVVWLAPQPSRPFRALTRAVWDAFPQCPPYGGAYAEVIPHLTIGDRRVGSVSALRAAEEAVRRGLPVRARIDEALLIAGSPEPDSWGVLRRLPLG